MPARYKSKQETGRKSPLHPSALTLNGLTPGRTIVQFNRRLGVMGTYVVQDYPRIHDMLEVAGS
jgi:hypothetical protein